MTNVIIAGDGGGQLTQTIFRACEKHGGVWQIDSRGVRVSGKDPAFCLMTAGCIGDLSCSGIVVFGREACRVGRLSGMVGIVEDGNTVALRTLAATGCSNVVTCSVSGRATVGLSGMAGRKKLVSLQRSLQCLDGTVIEPCEFLVSPSEETDWYPLLAACAVLLSADGVQTEQEIRF